MAVLAKGKIAGYLSSAEQVRIVWEIRDELTALAAREGVEDADLLPMPLPDC